MSPGPSSRATSSAAWTAVPHEPPMSRPSSLRHPAGGEKGVGVAHFDHAIDERRVEGRRPEVFSDTLDEVRPPRPAGVHRTRRVGADDLDVRVLRLQVARDSGDRAAGADAGDEVGDLAVGLPPDLRARSSVRARAGSPDWSTGQAGTRPASPARAVPRSSSSERGSSGGTAVGHTTTSAPYERSSAIFSSLILSLITKMQW